MRVMEARELFRQLTVSYFSGAKVVFSHQSRSAKQQQPLVLLTTGNLNRPAAPNCYTVDGSTVGSYLSRLTITVDLFSNGAPVVDPETGRTVAYEDNALDDMLSFADFINSAYAVRWCHEHDVAIVIDGDVLNMTGLINDNNYEYRARMTVLFYFTQRMIDNAPSLSEESIVYPTGDPEHPYTPVEPVETESATGGLKTDYMEKMEHAKIEPVYKPTASGGGSEELAQDSVGYFNEAEIKEEKL